MVELNSESRCRQPALMAAITRRAQTLARQREHRGEQRRADRTEGGRRPHHPRARQEREVPTGGR